eukprot:8775708-Alexandrium_andersonii.AAC.1
MNLGRTSRGSPSCTCTGMHLVGPPGGKAMSCWMRSAWARREASAWPARRWAARRSGSRSAWCVR